MPYAGDEAAIARSSVRGQRDRLYLDAVGLLHGLREIVGGLHPQPYFRAAAKCLGQAYRHLRADAVLAVDQIAEREPRYAQDVRAAGDAEAQRLQAVLQDVLPGMGR